MIKQGVYKNVWQMLVVAIFWPNAFRRPLEHFFLPSNEYWFISLRVTHLFYLTARLNCRSVECTFSVDVLQQTTTWPRPHKADAPMFVCFLLLAAWTAKILRQRLFRIVKKIPFASKSLGWQFPPHPDANWMAGDILFS